MPPFETFYKSELQQPLLLWVSVVVSWLMLGWQWRAQFLVPWRWIAYAVGFTVISLLDAWLTSDRPWGIGALPAALASTLPIAFVILGDARYFLVIFDSKWKAFIYSLVVPISSTLVHRLLPGEWASARVLFLIYELMFFGLALGLGKKKGDWRISGFVAAYYFLWASADIVILAGKDWGYLLRVVPNLLYYGALVPWVSFSLASRLHAAGPSESRPGSRPA